MNVKRLTTVAAVVHYWDFFHSGLVTIQRFLKYDIDMETYRKIICFLVRQPNAYVSIVFNENTPVGFGIAHECTPMFSQIKEYEVSILYHQPKETEATSALQKDFERFCFDNQVKSYYLTTRRDSGSAIRCFQAPRFGMKRTYTVFKKDL